MKCHNCQAKTEVEETRVIEENPRWTKRRRVCKNCGFTLWTVEMPAEDVVVKEKNTMTERQIVNWSVGFCHRDTDRACMATCDE
jgi:transcriptional regulator NrdR family protein